MVNKPQHWARRTELNSIIYFFLIGIILEVSDLLFFEGKISITSLALLVMGSLVGGSLFYTILKSSPDTRNKVNKNF